MDKKALMAMGLTEEQADQILKDLVPKTRLDQVIQERDTAKGQVAERDASIEGLKKQVKDNETLQTTITTLQTQLSDKDKQIAATQKEAAIKLALGTAKAKNPKAVMALLETDKLELQADGTIKGLTEALEGLKKSDAYLFDVETKPTGKPSLPPQPGFNPPPAATGNEGAKSFTELVAAAYNPPAK